MAGYGPTSRDFAVANARNAGRAQGYQAGVTAGQAQAAAQAPAPATPSGPSDFQTLAQALTAIYGGTTSPAAASIPTAVVPVDTGSGGGGVDLASFKPLALLLLVAGLAWAGYHWWQRHHKGAA